MYTISTAQQGEAQEIYALMEQVHSEMEHPEHFVCDDLPFVERHIRAEGFCLIARDEKKQLIGSLIVRFPQMAEDNLGRDIGLKQEELVQVAHMESAVVSRRARGQGILFALLQEAEQICSDRGCRYLMATVSPENPASYKSLEKQGFAVMVTKPKYGGLMRRIYCRKLW